MKCFEKICIKVLYCQDDSDCDAKMICKNEICTPDSITECQKDKDCPKVCIPVLVIHAKI